MTSMHLPHYISGTTRSVLFMGPTIPELMKLRVEPVLPWIESDLKDQGVVISISKMRSRDLRGHTFDFQECLIKVPIDVSGYPRALYPLMTYVDNPLSFIRGFLLGYEKELVHKSQFLAIDSFLMPNFRVDLCRKNLSRLAERSIDEEKRILLTSGALVGRDFNFGRGISVHGYSTPQIDEHYIESRTWYSGESSAVQIEDEVYAGSYLCETVEQFKLNDLGLG